MRLLTVCFLIAYEYLGTPASAKWIRRRIRTVRPGPGRSFADSGRLRSSSEAHPHYGASRYGEAAPPAPSVTTYR
jgi:hypothetical protein